MWIRAALMLAVLLIGAAPVVAQQTDEVNPDRPGVANGADVVPRGAVQLETGVGYARERHRQEPAQRRTSIATTVRFGLLDGLELRIDGEPFVALRDGDDATNVGDVALGAKWRLLEGDESSLRPTISLLPSVKLPTAPDAIGTRRPDFSVLGLASVASGRLGFDFNAGVAAIGQRDSDSYLVQVLLVGAPSFDVTDKLRAFAEAFVASRAEREGDDMVGVSVGAVYKLSRSMAVDTAVTSVVAGRGPDYRIEAGLTIKFGR